MDELRQKANAKFQAGEFKDAVRLYTEAIGHQQGDSELMRKFLRELDGGVRAQVSQAGTAIAGAFKSLFSVSRSNSQEFQNVDAKQLSRLYSNRSVALLAIQTHATVPPIPATLSLEDAVRATELDETWTKAWMRQGDALMALTRYEDAQTAYAHALEFCDVVKDRSPLQLKVLQANILLHLQCENARIMQLVVGKDFATGGGLNPVASLISQAAQQLQNYVYVIACEVTRKCVLVDACWDTQSIIDVVRVHGYQLVGCIVTHHHFDHVGGLPPAPYDKYGVRVDGVAKLLHSERSLSAYIHERDVAGVVELNPGMSTERVTPTYDGYELKVGQSVVIQFVHTPGHTQGSQCLLVNGHVLLTGDTLFVRSCGRTDFPESSNQQLFDSMQKLKQLAPANNEDVLVYAGHAYGGTCTTLKREMAVNTVMLAKTFAEFEQVFKK